MTAHITKLQGATPQDVTDLLARINRQCTDGHVYAIAVVCLTPDEIVTDWAGNAPIELIGALDYAKHQMIEGGWE